MKDRPQLTGGRRDDVQYFGGCRLLLQRLVALASQMRNLMSWLKAEERRFRGGLVAALRFGFAICRAVAGWRVLLRRGLTGPPWATTLAYQISRSIMQRRSDKSLRPDTRRPNAASKRALKTSQNPPARHYRLRDLCGCSLLLGPFVEFGEKLRVLITRSTASDRGCGELERARKKP